jgi:hypothetical protein
VKKDPFLIITALDIPGEGDDIGCERFATQAFGNLIAEGWSALVLAYHWKAVTFAGQVNDLTGMEDNHAIVVYRNEAGEVWAADAMNRLPRQIPAGDAETIQGIAAWFAGVSKEISHVRTLWDFNWPNLS